MSKEKLKNCKEALINLKERIAFNQDLVKTLQLQITLIHKDMEITKTEISDVISYLQTQGVFE